MEKKTQGENPIEKGLRETFEAIAAQDTTPPADSQQGETDPLSTQEAFLNDCIFRGMEFAKLLNTNSEAYKAGARYGYSCGYEDGYQDAQASLPATPEGDAVAFAEWISDNAWVRRDDFTQLWTDANKQEYESRDITTAELYNIFTSQKK